MKIMLKNASFYEFICTFGVKCDPDIHMFHKRERGLTWSTTTRSTADCFHVYLVIIIIINV